jgi:acid phosphatase type 7
VRIRKKPLSRVAVTLALVLVAASNAASAGARSAVGQHPILGAGLGPGETLASRTDAGSTEDPVVWAAGDISRPPERSLAPQVAVSDIAASAPANDGVLVMGDTQYGQAQRDEYNGAFACGMAWPDSTCPDIAEQNWGRLIGSMYTAPGEHDWKSGSIEDYITWLSDAAAGHAEHSPGPGTIAADWYSFNIGSWHWLSLDSTCFTNDQGCRAAESAFVKQDLASLDHAAYPCIGVFLAEPRFASGIKHGSDPSLAPLWTLLMPGGVSPDGPDVDQNVDVMLTGHEHNYERFAAQDARGEPTSAGIREFIVGTGGVAHTGLPFGGSLGDVYDPGCHTDGCGPDSSECIQDFGQQRCSGTPADNSQVGNDDTWGMLQLQLGTGHYLWRFVPTTQPNYGTFMDPPNGGFGSHDCHT